MSGWGSIYNNTTYAMWKHTRDLAKLHEQGASGARVNRASDDPLDAYRIMRLKASGSSSEAYLKNLQEVERNLEAGHSLLSKLSTTAVRAEELLTQAASGTYIGANRIAIAEELDSLLEQSVTLVNTQNMGLYVFSGDTTATAPYEVTRENGKIVAVRYAGSTRDLAVPIAEGVSYSGVMVGDSVLTANRRSAPTFYSDTGVKVGTNTSSVTGNAWLEIAHSTTTYTAGSQLSAGTSSATGDTLIGSHTIKISAADKTIQVGSGPQVTFVGDETNLQLTDGNGQVLHIDMTGWTDANGEFTVTSNAKMSIDAGQTWKNVDLASANNAVTNGATGDVLYVDARTLDKTGVAAVNIAGTRDIFEVLIQARDLLESDGEIPDDMLGELLHISVEAMREAQGNVTRSMTAVGGRLQAMDSLRINLEDARDAASDQAKSLEQADIAQIAVDIVRIQNLYDMTLATAGKLLSMSLMDYL